MSLSVIVHPSLTVRVVLACILAPAFICITLIPLDRFQHASLRVATSATGAFGIVLSIALLARIPAYGNAWERWWQRDKLEWGSRKEKGLSAALLFIFLTGLASDRFLLWKFGACPDEVSRFSVLSPYLLSDLTIAYRSGICTCPPTPSISLIELEHFAL